MRVNDLKFAGQRHTATYITTGTVEIGDAVVMTAGGTVARGAGIPVGIITAVEADNRATVLLYGEVITANAAAQLTPGYAQVTANASGQLVAAGENPGRPAIIHAASATEAAVTLL
ncbi:MAG: hypothetical protein WCY60_01820 [Trueperaceae bacterium]